MAIRVRQIIQDQVVDPIDFTLSHKRSPTAFLGDRCQDAPSVGGIGTSSNQVVDLESIDQLGNVRLDAPETLADNPKSNWLAGVHKNLENS